MSTEEIIQRTRLLDSEIKVGGEAPSRCSRPHTQGRPWCSHLPLSRHLRHPSERRGDRGFLLRPEKEERKGRERARVVGDQA